MARSGDAQRTLPISAAAKRLGLSCQAVQHASPVSNSWTSRIATKLAIGRFPLKPLSTTNLIDPGPGGR